MPFGTLIAFDIRFQKTMIAIAKIQDGGQKSKMAANVTNIFCDE